MAFVRPSSQIRASVATILGTSSRVITGSGALLAPSATISGTGPSGQTIIGSGVLNSLSAAISGAGGIVGLLAQSLSLSAKRYDGGSGAAIFNGPITFQQGQMQPSGLSNISIWDGVTELPIAVIDSDLRHTDGSVKIAFVHASLSAADQVEVPLTLQLSTAPTAGTVTPETVTKDTLVAPRVLGCNDADHLCASRVALGPLIPISKMVSLAGSDPAMSQWVNTLTVEFDSKDAGGAVGYGWAKDYFDRDDQTNGWPLGSPGNACYNAVYPMYCRYLVTGAIDDLYYANGIAAWNNGWQWTMGEHSHGNGVLTHQVGGATYTTDFDYGLAANSQPITNSEQHSGSSKDAYMCWSMSGWRQARAVGMAYGARNAVAEAVVSGASIYGGRVDFRWFREYANYLPLFRVDADLNYNSGAIGSIESPVSDWPWWENLFQTHWYDKFESWSLTMGGGDPRYNIWGNAPSFDSIGGGGGIPFFQNMHIFDTIYTLEQNTYQDNLGRTWNQLESLADYLETKVAGPFTQAWGGIDVYGANYATEGTIPTGTTNDGQYSVCMNIPLFSWAYAKTGQQKYLDIIDAMSRQQAWSYGGSGSAGCDWKAMPQFYGFLFHAAAWRFGVPHDGWELPHTAPRGYAGGIQEIIGLLNASGANFAAGGTNPAAAEYAENNTRTVFYSAAENLWRGQNWGVRTGNALNDLSAGRDRALMVQLDRWGVGGQAAWHRAADVAYYAVQEGDWTTDRVAVENDIILHARSEDPKFAFSRLHEYKIGTQDNPNEDFYGFRTTMSRPSSLWAKALIYEEKQGLGRRVDPFQGPELCIDWAMRMISSHLYRWRTEQTDFLEPGAKSDDYANFMTALSIDAVRVATEWFEENIESRDIYFPSTVFDGTVASNSYIANPFTNWDDQITDFLIWQAGALEPGWTIDTRAFPQSDTTYPRVSNPHTPPDSGFPKPSNASKVLGDPMIYNESGPEGDYAVLLYRSGYGAYKAQNIQMMNATNFWWMASRLNGINNALRDKMIEWGDKIFYGATVNDLSGLDQKASNQTLYLFFEGIEYRNAATGGRND